MPTTGAERLTEVMLLIFRLNGQLLRQGDRKVAHLGLTSARWQMLGAVALAPGPRTAPELAAQMGVSRQGAQKQLNLLVEDGLLAVRPNPRHARSPWYELTEVGRQVYAATERVQAEWAQRLVAALPATGLEAARQILAALSDELGRS